MVTALTFSVCSRISSQPNWTLLAEVASGLKNFHRLGDANWRAEDSAIVADDAKVAS